MPSCIADAFLLSTVDFENRMLDVTGTRVFSKKAVDYDGW